VAPNYHTSLLSATLLILLIQLTLHLHKMHTLAVEPIHGAPSGQQLPHVAYTLSKTMALGDIVRDSQLHREISPETLADSSWKVII